MRRRVASYDKGLKIIIYVYQQYGGSLVNLRYSKISQNFRPIIFEILASVKPTVSAKLVSNAIIIGTGKIESGTIISDGQSNNKFYNFMKHFRFDLRRVYNNFFGGYLH